MTETQSDAGQRTRDRLPNRRGGETRQFMYRKGIQAIATIGYYDDGRIGEVFLSAGKAGTDLAVQFHETAIAVSMALQYGCPIERLRSAMPRTADGKPEGAIGMLLDILAEDEAA